MKLAEITNLILETIRGSYVVDDERIDLRMLNNLVRLKRDQYIKNELNKGNFFTENATQRMSLTFETVTGTSGGLYNTNGRRILRTTTKIPRITEYSGGLAIQEVTDGALISLPFSKVSFEHLRFVGNNRFNEEFLFVAIMEDQLYVSQVATGTAFTTGSIVAIFQDPLSVTGFDEETDDYPANDYMVEYIKNAIIQEDLKTLIVVRSDEISDGTGDIRNG